MSDSWTTWPAPAKLNLFLHIVGRRADGYHLLQTVFQLLDFGDTVRLRTRKDGAIVRTQKLPGILPEADLCLRAARLLQRHTDCPLGADIALTKRIPVGGGLGGGSSDAASVLLGLNALWGAHLETDVLAELGLELGADVPLFIRGRSAWGEGVGDELIPIELDERLYVILDPKVFVSTVELFRAPELTRNAEQMTIQRFNSGTMKTMNVFEPVVRARYEPVAAALDWLAQFGTARLSGSGGCVYLAVSAMDEANAIVSQCPARFAAFIARGVNQSALLAAVARFSAGTSPSW